MYAYADTLVVLQIFKLIRRDVFYNGQAGFPDGELADRRGEWNCRGFAVGTTIY